ncbi:hypothetical protein [Actinomadura violacea]|uniref:Uncharacterized protein n=1 Tax=Actinomadura violacea TaxID=2819934 RepID=A0ABS3RVN5_9ACTN|nr:hypothetical protein [Actinomadura violacea]MBO2460358.1 hypothetical protein [Actinomadura violacea]
MSQEEPAQVDAATSPIRWGAEWRMVPDEDDEDCWHVTHHGHSAGIITWTEPQEGPRAEEPADHDWPLGARPGWRAATYNGWHLPAEPGFSYSPRSTETWRTRELAAAAVARFHLSHCPPDPDPALPPEEG